MDTYDVANVTDIGVFFRFFSIILNVVCAFLVYLAKRVVFGFCFPLF